MDDSFDPYLQWLGIRDAERPPNFYTLLGVAPLESDTDVISNATDRQMAHVRTFQTGKYSDVSQRLLNELAKAKVCLLNADKKAAYDKKLSDKLAAAQAAEDTARAAEPAPVPTSVPAAAAAPQIDSGHGGFAGVAVGAGPSPGRSMADRSGRSSSRKNNKTLLLSAGIGLFGIGIIIAVVVAVNQGRGDGGNGSNVKKGKTPEVTVPPVKTDTETPLPRPKDPDERNQPVKPENGGPKIPPEVEVVKVPSTAKWPWSPREQVEPPARDAPPVKLSALVLKSLRAARRAMQDRDLDQADAQIEAAATAAKTTVEKGEVDRHREINFMLQSYWNAVAAGLSKAAAGETLTYRDGKVTIVEVGNGQIKLKADNGAEESFDTDRKKIDLDVAHALAQDRLDDMGPVGLAAVGAAKAMDRQIDIARARELWKEALRNGIPVSHFVPESKYDFSKLVADVIAPPPPGSRKPVPPKGDRANAVKEVRKLFGAPIRQVKTAEQAKQARERADKMLAQAENPANRDPMRYELFEEGIDQLALTGALEEARGAIDELAKTFEVDHVDRTAAMMISMVNFVVNPEAATALIEEIKKFAYEAAAMEKIDIASALIGSAKKLAGRLESKKKHRPLTKNLARFPRFFGALKKLAQNADDPAAHLIVGEFQCYTMDDWDRGLKHLAKVSDKQLSELARDDLASPRDNEAQLALGDRWWELHDKKPTRSQMIERVAIGRRAKHWYEASSGLGKGTDIVTREKNLKTLAEEMDQLNIVPPEGLNLLANWKAETGSWGPRDGALTCPWSRGIYPRITFPIMPTGAYRLDIECERLPPKGPNDWIGPLILYLPTPGASHCALTVSCATTAGYNGIVVTPGTAGKRLGGFPYRPKSGRYKLSVWVTPVSGGAVKIEAKLNDRPITSWSGPIAQLKPPKPLGSSYELRDTRYIGVGVASGGMKIYKVQFQGSRTRK